MTETVSILDIDATSLTIRFNGGGDLYILLRMSYVFYPDVLLGRNRQSCLIIHTDLYLSFYRRIPYKNSPITPARSSQR